MKKSHPVSKGGEPELIDLLVRVQKVNLAHPEERTARRLAFDADNRIVVGVNPDFAVDQLLSFDFRRHLQNIRLS